jgi:penicillin-binding protein 2B
MSKKQPNMNAGAAALFVIFGLLFFILLYRYYSIEITGEVGGQSLAAKAQAKHSRVGTLEATRGTIFDRNGEIIAEDTASYSLVAILDKKMTTNSKKPQHVVDPDRTAGELAKYIKLSESKIHKILTKKGQFQVEFGKAGRDISFSTKKKIEALHLPGITFIRDSKRFYPNGIFASHLVGYADRVEQKDGTYKEIGKMGVEKTLNTSLTGQNGKVNTENDLWGYILPDDKPKVTPAKNGSDVYLTLDKKIQTFLEDAINKVDAEYKPKKIIAIVADPKTGNILAMGQRPTFHPKTKEGIEKSWHNEAVETSFEPGSTMKVFTLSAAVQENVFNPHELYKSGTYKVTPNSKAVRDWNNGVGWGSIPFLEGVQRSSNVAFAKMANEKLGFERFREYLTKFGFDRPTGIELPEETSGSILFQWPIEKATTAFGQGSTITPIQQIQAATAVANDGKMMKPNIVEKIVNHDTGEMEKKSVPEVVSTPISAETAKKVRDFLETVITSPKGTGARYGIEGYSVAGKTGTAQIPDPHGGYLEGQRNYIFSFLGMAPKDDPKLIVYVAVQQPNVEFYTDGSIPVSEIFKPVMKNSLQYLNIQPSNQEKATANKLPNFSGKPVQNVVTSLTEKGFETVVLGNGSEVKDQLPKEGITVLEGEKILIKTGGEMKLPDMTGWSLRDVMKLAQLADLKLNTSGNGYVSKQNIKAGTPVKEGDDLIIHFSTPEQQIKKSASKKDENKEKEVKD